MMKRTKLEIEKVDLSKRSFLKSALSASAWASGSALSLVISDELAEKAGHEGFFDMLSNSIVDDRADMPSEETPSNQLLETASLSFGAVSAIAAIETGLHGLRAYEALRAGDSEHNSDQDLTP